MSTASSSRSASPSIIEIEDSDASEYAPESSGSGRGRQAGTVKGKRKRAVEPKIKRQTKVIKSDNDNKKKLKDISGTGAGGEVHCEDIEDADEGMSVHRPHGLQYHETDQVAKVQYALLAWFEQVREKRGMPWRKRYDPTASIEEKGQRAYEIWVSEVMLQQTQVATVIAYWQRWIARWPTIADLAKADIEEVNAAWRGLGYYRRARSLLAGAKTVMSHSKYEGRLPDDPVVLEKEIDGVGRYTAGAICSMAYGVRTPIVDGNIHRLLTRLLAVHAPQTSPATIKFLWTVAQELIEALPSADGEAVNKGIAGDWNQALMEHGSQICKPVSPDCGVCPLKSSCKAFAELSTPPSLSAKPSCTLCAPIPTASPETICVPSVTVFPMRKEKKVSRAEEEAVCVVEWRGEEGRRWLFVKRPERGLLAGLFEPPTTPVPPNATTQEQSDLSLAALSSLLHLSPSKLSAITASHKHVGAIPHIFSHINMTYHIQHLILHSSSLPIVRSSDTKQVIWLDESGVEGANVGTGVKKVWAEVYGSWGKFDALPTGKGGKKTAAGGKRNKVGGKALAEIGIPGKDNGKIVKKVMMPAMPVRKVEVVSIEEAVTVVVE